MLCMPQGHRLVLLAEQYGKASEAEDLLFEAIYEKGTNVSDVTVLEQLGEQLHLPGVTKQLLPCLQGFEILQNSGVVLATWCVDASIAAG